MAVAFLRSNGKSSFGASDNIASNAIEVAAGNLVVVMVGGNISTDAPTITDSEGNSYIHRDLISSTNAYCRVAYSFIATGDASLIVTATWAGSETERKEIIVAVFSKDGGSSWSFDVGDNTGTAFGTAAASGTLTTTGTDEVTIAFQRGNATTTISSQEIAGGAAINTQDIQNSAAWYRLFSSTQSNITATATLNTNAWWVVDFLTFKAVAAAPGGIVVLRRRRM